MYASKSDRNMAIFLICLPVGSLVVQMTSEPELAKKAKLPIPIENLCPRICSSSLGLSFRVQSYNPDPFICCFVVNLNCHISLHTQKIMETLNLNPNQPCSKTSKDSATPPPVSPAVPNDLHLPPTQNPHLSYSKKF